MVSALETYLPQHPDPSLASTSAKHERAVQVGRKLYAGTFGRLHLITAGQERVAFDYFTKHADKEYGFVPCVSFVVMEKLGIEVAWTVDGQEGREIAAAACVADSP